MRWDVSCVQTQDLQVWFPVVLGLNDFSLDELMNIAHSNIRRYDFIIAPEAETKLRELIKSASRNKNFGNARFVVTLIENHVIPNLCMRLDRIANIAPDSDLYFPPLSQTTFRIFMQYLLLMSRIESV